MSRAPAGTEGATDNDEKADDKVSEKEHGTAELRSISEGEGPVIVPDPDLDPAALHKAFRFAAWSSVLLVCNLFFFLGQMLMLLCLLDGYYAHSDSTAAVLCEHHFWRAWAHRLGRHRHHLVLLFCVLRRLVPLVGEPRRPCPDRARYHQGASY